MSRLPVIIRSSLDENHRVAITPQSFQVFFASTPNDIPSLGFSKQAWSGIGWYFWNTPGKWSTILQTYFRPMIQIREPKKIRGIKYFWQFRHFHYWVEQSGTQRHIILTFDHKCSDCLVFPFFPQVDQSQYLIGGDSFIDVDEDDEPEDAGGSQPNIKKSVYGHSVFSWQKFSFSLRYAFFCNLLSSLPLPHFASI